MSSTTPNIGLTKTTAAETIGQNWAASNDSGGNFDIIDTKMGAVGNTSLQAQVTALNSKIAYFTDVQITISSTNLINVDLPSLSGRRVLAVSFIYNSGLYYALIDDNRQLYVSLRDTNNTITVIQVGGTRSTDRTITVRVHYTEVGSN